MIDRKDPKYLEALRLWDLSGLDESWGMPSDPHARDNLRYATGYLAEGSDPDDAERFLRLVLNQYVGAKYRDAMERDVRRLAKRAREVVSEHNDSERGE